MSAQRKLQAEIDRVLKKVAEGVEEFESIRDKVYDANNHQRDKHELELKKSIKRLQRMRDQIKGWISGNDIKDKRVLVETRKLIETKMERYRTAERDSKNRTFHPSNNKDDEETTEAKKWLAAARDELEEQKTKMESEIDSLNEEGSQEVMERIITLDCAVERHEFHLNALERISVLLENEELKPEQIMAISDAVDNYVQNNQEVDFYEDDELYHELGIINEDTGELKEYHAVALSSAPTTASVADGPSTERKKDDAPEELAPAPSPKISNNAMLNVTGDIAEAAAAASVSPSSSSTSAGAAAPSALPPPRKSSSSAPTKPTSTPTTPKQQRGSPLTTGLTAAAVAAAGQKRSAQQAAKGRTAKAAAQAAAQAAATAQAAAHAAAQAQAAAQVAETQRRKHEEAQQALAQQQQRAQQKALKAQQQQAKVQARQQAANVKAQAYAHAQAQVQSQSQAQTQQQANAQQQQQQGGSRASNLAGAANGASSVVRVSGSGAVGAASSNLSPLESGTIAGTNLSHLFPQRSPTPSSAQPVAALTPEEKHYRKLMLLGSMDFMPTAADSERPREYVPSQPCSTPAHFPQTPLANFEDPSMFAKLDNDTLFFTFYYQQGTYQQYLAAKELKLGSWRYHKKYLTWFQRHEPPKEITKEYEQGTYVYFDYETGSGWCQRRKEGFRFNYRYLEDEDM